MLKYYDNYLRNLAKTPNEEYRELQQAIVDSRFENTTLLKNVLEEQNNNFKFNPIEVWLGTVTDAITNTAKDVADFRHLYFRNCNHDVRRGKYYYFENNYWLVYESSTYLEAQSNCKVRRCNNKLKWKDKENGKTIEYPCILEYNLSSPRMKVSKEINTPDSHVTVLVQGNEDTLKIEKNQRFIFNDKVYRFTAINDYLQSSYTMEQVPLLTLECYLDVDQIDDDFNNDVANHSDYNYEINILEESFEQVKGFKGQLHATILLNGEEIKKEIIWKTTNPNIVSIDSQGNYELVGNNGEECFIYATLKNSSILDEIKISIKQNVVLKDDLIIDPIVNKLSLYDSVTFTANLYQNGAKKDNKVNCEVINLSEEYYELKDNLDNTFTLTNNKASKTPLKLRFYCDDNNYEETIDILLGSLF